MLDSSEICNNTSEVKLIVFESDRSYVTSAIPNHQSIKIQTATLKSI